MKISSSKVSLKYLNLSAVFLDKVTYSAYSVISTLNNCIIFWILTKMSLQYFLRKFVKYP